MCPCVFRKSKKTASSRPLYYKVNVLGCMIRQSGTALLSQASSLHQRAPLSMKCSVQNLGIVYEFSHFLHQPTFNPLGHLVGMVAKHRAIAPHLPLLSSTTTEVHAGTAMASPVLSLLPYLSTYNTYIRQPGPGIKFRFLTMT